MSALLRLIVLVVLCAPLILSGAQVLRFGEIRVGEWVERTSRFVNTSENIVHIHQVAACCGAEADLAPMTLAPHEAAVLRVRLRQTMPGPFEKSVRLTTDNVEDPVVTIPILGEAIEEPRVAGFPRSKAVNFIVRFIGALVFGIILTVLKKKGKER